MKRRDVLGLLGIAGAGTVLPGPVVLANATVLNAPEGGSPLVVPKSEPLVIATTLPPMPDPSATRDRLCLTGWLESMSLDMGMQARQSLASDWVEHIYDGTFNASLDITGLSNDVIRWGDNRMGGARVRVTLEWIK